MPSNPSWNATIKFLFAISVEDVDDIDTPSFSKLYEAFEPVIFAYVVFSGIALKYIELSGLKSKSIPPYVVESAVANDADGIEFLNATFETYTGN
jgi:hypothetical protein